MAQNTRLLKAIVIGLGILLVVGFGLLMATIAYRATGLSRNDGAPAAALRLPPDARILTMALGEEGLALHVQSESGEEILIVDTRKGQIVRRVAVARE